MARCRWIAALCLGALLTGVGGGAAGAAPGSIDRSFGRGGLAATMLGPEYGVSRFTNLVAGPDGGVSALVAHPFHAEGTSRRFRADGSVDPDFVPQSVALEAPVNAGKMGDEVPFGIEAVVPLASGKVLAAGRGFFAPGGHDVAALDEIYVARFESNGSLDGSFGNAGVVRLRTAHGLAGTGLKALIPRDDGGALVAVNAFRANELGETAPASFVARLNGAGDLDRAYGDAGTIALDGSVVGVHSLPGERIAVAANSWGAQPGTSGVRESDFFLGHYTAAGQPDPGFASGTGSVTTDFGGADVPHSVLWGADGSTVLAGSTVTLTATCLCFYDACREEPVLTRFTPAGGLDPGFGSNGIQRLPGLAGPAGFFGGGALSLSSRPGGGLFAGGGSGVSRFIAALDASGRLDPGFGVGGVVAERDSMPSSSQVNDIAVDPQGRILVSGASSAGRASSAFDGAVVRYLRNGTLDTGFGQGGYARVPQTGNAIAVAGDGSSFVLSHGGRYATVTKVDAAGGPDPSFGEEGTVRFRTRFGANLALKTIAARPDGGVVAAGGVYRRSRPWRRVLAVALGPDGRPDPAFGHNGRSAVNFGRNRVWGVRGVAVEPNGGILLAGFASRRAKAGKRRPRFFALMRLRPDGSIDRRFGRHGSAIAPAGASTLATDLTLRAGRILVAGRRHARRRVTALVVRYSRGGKIDPRFGRHGIARVTMPTPGPHFRAEESVGLAVGRHRIYLVKAGPGRPVAALRPSGRIDRSFVHPRAVARGRIPAKFPFPAGPVAALQGDRLVLAWTKNVPVGSGNYRRKVYLQRLR